MGLDNVYSVYFYGRLLDMVSEDDTQDFVSFFGKRKDGERGGGQGCP